MIRFTSLSIALLLTAAGSAQAEDAKPAPFKPAFYAFQNGVNFGSPEHEAKTLKELGYAGINQVKHGGAKLAAKRAILVSVSARLIGLLHPLRSSDSSERAK